MASKKRKLVTRCFVCGIKATGHVSSSLPVCDNIACDEFRKEIIKAALDENSTRFTTCDDKEVE